MVVSGAGDSGMSLPAESDTVAGGNSSMQWQEDTPSTRRLR
jgi:hypothetical protein